MTSEEIKAKSYKSYFVGGKNNSFAFYTENGVSYEIKFKPSSYLFDNYSSFPIVAYEFVIEVAINQNEKRPPLDPKIPYTIASIFRDFFSKNNEQVIIYICDSSDARQEARRRKFNQWVELFRGNEFLKIDSEIIEPSGVIYYNSLILRTNNSHRNQIVEAFIDLSAEQQK